MLQPRDVVAKRGVDGSVAVGAFRRAKIRQRLEIDIVAVAAAIEPDHQDHLALQQAGETERAERKARGLAEKIDT